MLRDPDLWQARLPHEFQALIVWPQRVEAFRDDGVPAAKWRGYDEHGDLCYYRHRFTLWHDVYDDEEPYRRLMQSESLEAWRCLDGRWLRSLQRSEGDGRCGERHQDSGLEMVASQAIPRL